MKSNANIQLHGYYTCKVTNKVVTIQIFASSPKGGWEALNTVTGKKIHIKGPERLIKKVPAPKEKVEGAKPEKTAPIKKSTPKNESPKKTATSATSKLSLLDAAVKVLEKQAPLTCGQLIEHMSEAGLWKSDAATPANTLHAAISKEIRVKGNEARFEKIDRGQFALASTK